MARMEDSFPGLASVYGSSTLMNFCIGNVSVLSWEFRPVSQAILLVTKGV